MIESILEFLTSQRSIIVGAAVTIAEALTVLINFWRKNKSEKATVKLMNAGQSFGNFTHTTKGQKFLWSLNPINLFRKP